MNSGTVGVAKCATDFTTKEAWFDAVECYKTSFCAQS